MDDHETDESKRAPGTSGRMRGMLDRVRRQGAASLDSVRRSMAEAGSRIRNSQAAERIGAAVEARRVVRKAAEAQERGNFSLAFRLLEPEVRERPDDARVVVAFWQAALACERARDAAPYLIHLIRHLAAAEAPRAAALWAELHGALPDARVDAGSLVRIATACQARGDTQLALAALRDAVDPENHGLSPGLAVRVAEMARELDVHTARLAAEHALGSPDLHEAKRARLRRLVVDLDRAERTAAAEGAAAEDPKPAEAGSGEITAAPLLDAADAVLIETGEQLAAAVGPDALVTGVLDALAPAARFHEIKVREGMPVGLGDEGVVLLLSGGRKGRIEYAKIEALAVAEIADLGPHPVTVIDLVLNWSASEDAVLRVLRLRGDGFDARMLVETGPGEEDATAKFVAEILARSGATPLSDRDHLRGGSPPGFESLEAYEREVLQVASPRG